MDQKYLELQSILESGQTPYSAEWLVQMVGQIAVAHFSSERQTEIVALLDRYLELTRETSEALRTDGGV